jgi:hypothetical protein
MPRPKNRSRKRPRNTGSVVKTRKGLAARWFVDGRDAQGNPTKVQRWKSLPGYT